MTEDASQETPPKSAAGAGSLIAWAAVLVAGWVLNWMKPVWLAPPLFVYTGLVYLALASAWLLLAIPILWRVWLGGTSRMRLIGMAAMVMMCILTCGFASGGFNPSVITPGLTTCESQPLPSSRVRYTCTYTMMFYYEIYTLEGQEGSPFVTLQSKQVGES